MDMRRFWMDLCYGTRGLGNQPGFAAIAILTLALGIGASTTIFSVIYNVLLDPFPYTDAKRVVAIQIHDLATAARAGGSTSKRRSLSTTKRRTMCSPRPSAGISQTTLTRTTQETTHS